MVDYCSVFPSNPRNLFGSPRHGRLTLFFYCGIQWVLPDLTGFSAYSSVTYWIFQVSHGLHNIVPYLMVFYFAKLSFT